MRVPAILGYVHDPFHRTPGSTHAMLARPGRRIREASHERPAEGARLYLLRNPTPSFVVGTGPPHSTPSIIAEAAMRVLTRFAISKRLSLPLAVLAKPLSTLCRASPVLTLIVSPEQKDVGREVGHRWSGDGGRLIHTEGAASATPTTTTTGSRTELWAPPNSQSVPANIPLAWREHSISIGGPDDA